MDHDKTMILATNLDRGAIEGKLAEAHASARASNLPQLAALFRDAEGMPRAQIEQRVGNALSWLADKPEHRGIRALLELVELNLPNLK